MSAVLVELGAGPVGQTVALVLAQDPAPPPGKGEEFGKASPVGLVVVVLLGIATALLIRSMNKRLRRLPASFDGEEQPDAAAAPEADDAALPDGDPAGQVVRERVGADEQQERADRPDGPPPRT